MYIAYSHVIITLSRDIKIKQVIAGKLSYHGKLILDTYQKQFKNP
ncbi:hypothetical protein ECH_1120 [Ehrlichia chaffeensis str. Arkansas]|uniref:Uncharacterized protein n=1 Tax=Ehrlichia chaffeensis (strain ATCC CRL-10679 / Arkansas) TaxID=205920 RepID=Q2GF79_EHRCR|nr:hypothetical protein ECH_1120 [Ehrlichia chaffeensis str. Arkansas]AHX07765.1 hypothetical protein ECHOSC_0064 [Ehrlichia chaffeensis str. Osceola]